MADPVEQLRSLMPRSKQTTVTTRRRRSALAPLPTLRPFVSKAAQKRAKERDTLTKLQAAKENNHSLGSQIGGVFGGLIPGAAHLIASGAKTAIGPARASIDLLRGDLDPDEFLKATSPTNLWSKGDEDSQALVHKYFPLTPEVVSSGKQTAGRIAQLGPVETRSVGGEQIQTYGDAIDQGQIVGAVLSDVGNLSLAGAGAGKVLGASSRLARTIEMGAAERAVARGAHAWVDPLEGAVGRAGGRVPLSARLEKAADVTKAVSRLGGQVSDAGLDVAIGGVLKGGKSLWRAAGQRAERALYRSLPTESGAGRRLVRAATPEGKLLKKGAQEGRTVPARLAAWNDVELAVDSGAMTRSRRGTLRPSKDGPSIEEQEVGLTRAVAVSQADKMVADQLGPEASIAAHVGPVNMIKPGETMTPEGQALGHAYERGELPADQMARIDKVEAAFRKRSAFETQRSLEDGMDPRYTGDEVLDDAVSQHLGDQLDPKDAKALEDLRRELAVQDRMWEPDFDKDIAYPPVSWKRMQRELDGTPEGAILDEILLDPQVYPAPWRETMHVFRKGTEEGAVGLPRTPDQILAAGIPRPSYMSGKGTDPNGARGAPTVATAEGLGGYRSISAEKHKATMGHGQYSLANASDAIRRSVHTSEYNRILRRYMQDRQLKNPVDVLSKPYKGKDGTTIEPVDWATIHDEAQRLVESKDLGGMSEGQIANEVLKERGRMVYSELTERGYDVLKGQRNEPRVGDFDPAAVPGKDFGWEEIGPDSIVLPAGLKARLIPYKTGADTNIAVMVSSKVNKEWKGQVLPLNAHWTIGDMMSNLITAWIAGKVNPAEMFMAGRRIKNLDPAVFDEILNRPELVKSGLKYQAAEALNPGVDLGNRAPGRLGFRTIRKAQNAGFRLNEFANRIQRHQYVYAKLERELQARGLADSIEGIGAGSARWKDPEVQRAINDVVNDGNKTLGTWDEMSPFEQRVLTQIFPFWSWIRHINTLVARTAVDSPTRVLWTLRVGQIGADLTPDDLPEWMRGSMDTPFGRVGLNWMNPFYDVGSGALLSPSTALRSTSPLIKFGTTALTGRDLNRNLNMVSHRPGSDPNQIASAFYGLTQASPFTRGALNLAPTADVPLLGTGLGPHRRYGSGETILTPGTDDPADNQSRIRKGLQMFNIPMPEPTNVVPATGSPFRRRKTGLGRSGLGSGRLKNTGLGG